MNHYSFLHSIIFAVVALGAGGASALDFTWTGASDVRDANGAKKWDDAGNWDCSSADRTRYPYPYNANDWTPTVIFPAGVGEETIALPATSGDMDLAGKLTMNAGAITFVRPAGATTSSAYCLACSGGKNGVNFGAANVTLDGVFLSASRKGGSLFTTTAGSGNLTLKNGAAFEAGDFCHIAGGTIRLTGGSRLRFTNSDANGGGLRLGGTSVIEIDDSTVQIDGWCNFGDKSAPGGKIIFRGAHPRLFVNLSDSQFKVVSVGTEFVFELPKGGYTVTDADGREQVWVPITTLANNNKQFPSNKTLALSIAPDSPVFESEFDAAIPLVGWNTTVGLAAPKSFLLDLNEPNCDVDGATCAWTVSTATGSCTAATDAAAAEEYVWTDYTNLNKSAISPVYCSLGVRIHGAGDDVPVKPSILSVSAVGESDGTLVVSFAATHAAVGTTAKVAVSTDGGVTWTERDGEIVRGTVTAAFDSFAFGEYAFKLTLTNEAGSDEASGAFTVTDTAVYTWQAADGMLDGAWTNRAHWSADRAVRADYPGAVGTAAVASFAGLGSVTVTVENAAAELQELVLGSGTVLRLSGTENALTLNKLTPSSSTLLFELPRAGYAHAPIAGSANAARLGENSGELQLLVDRASPYLERHFSVWRAQPLVDWPAGINSATVKLDAGDADGAAARVKPAAFDSRTAPKNVSVEVRGLVPTVVALKSAAKEPPPPPPEEEEPISEDGLVWSDATPTRGVNTCVILATKNNTLAAALTDRLNAEGATVMRVTDQFTAATAEARAKNAYLVARTASSKGEHNLAGDAKIGVIGERSGSRLAMLLATSSRTLGTPKLAFACVVSPDDFIVGGCANVTLNADGEPRVGDLYAPLDEAFKFDDQTSPVGVFYGDGDDPENNYWTAEMIYRRVRELTEANAEAHFYGAKETAGARLDRLIEFVKNVDGLGTLPSRQDIEVRYPEKCDAHDKTAYLKENIWPEDGKGPNPAAGPVPYIEWYFPTNRTTKSILVLYSGGGYQNSQPDGAEVAPARRVLNARGLTVVTLRYRSTDNADSGRLRAWQDLQRTIRIVRSRAEPLGLDPNSIGIMGSSAGGHLSIRQATSSQTDAYARIDELDDLPTSVRWAIPIYPAYIVWNGEWRGEDKDGIKPILESAALNFDSATPPMLFLHGDADLWTTASSMKMWEKLHQLGIETEMHTFAGYSHNFQASNKPGTGAYNYLDIIWEFITAYGFDQVNH